MKHQSSDSGDVFVPRSRFHQGPYGRMFRNLPAHVPTLDLLKGRWKFIKDLPDGIEEHLEKLSTAPDQKAGEQEFKMLKGRVVEPTALSNEAQKIILTEIPNALEDTEAGREAVLKLLAKTMIEPEEDNDQDEKDDNPDIPAGYTYFLQFIAHDITFDPTSSLMRFNDPDKLRNFRTPRLDLDSLYGGGPLDTPFFYNYPKSHGDSPESDKKYYFLIGKGESGNEEDLPRNSQGRALIGDPRNDENVILSQLHLAFIKFHNKILDDVICRGLKGNQAFQEAQRLVRWHYQWVILHDFLPKFVDAAILSEILDDCPNQPKLAYYQWREQPFIPVEFSVAAFRFGHSMIRDKYNLNFRTSEFIISLKSGIEDLLGFAHLKKCWTIQWDRFFKIKNSSPQKSRKIDTKLSILLSELPSPLKREDVDNLAALDLIRGYKMGLPSGQAVARAMGEKPLDEREDPLWYYILREAEECRSGRKLGPVGGRIVAEVIIGLLAGDPHSFFNVDREWQPLYSRGNKFELQDILFQASVPLTRKSLEKKFRTLDCI